jgi:hypothetical protein
MKKPYLKILLLPGSGAGKSEFVLIATGTANRYEVCQSETHDEPQGLNKPESLLV